MDFIFKRELLNPDKSKHINLQYYQWAQKKRLENQKAQYEQFKKRWDQLQSQEPKSLNKTYLGRKNKLADQKPLTIKPEVTYLKNMVWRQKVEEKLDKKRQQQIEQLQKQESKNQQPAMSKQQRKYRQPTHKGPIKAWDERFQAYLKTKSVSAENHFRPIINRNSKRMVNSMNQKVEDRLIEYGEKLRQKKAEMESAYEEQLYIMRNKATFQTDQNETSNIFWRLYKDGETINKKKNEIVQQYTFTPSINNISVQLASRISQNRKPLYQSKVVYQNTGNNKSKMTAKDKQQRIKGFENFLKRNQALLRKIDQHKFQRIQVVKSREKKQAKQCTFAPNLNPNSLRIAANKENDYRPPLKEMLHNQSSQDKQFKQVKKIPGVKSTVIDLDSNLRRQEVSSQKLKSQGNYLQPNLSNYISDIDSLSHVYVHQSERLDNIHTIHSNLNDSLSGQPELFNTDRNYQQSAVINEQIEEDSIEREKQALWENQLEKLELQIQGMMKRAVVKNGVI